MSILPSLLWIWHAALAAVALQLNLSGLTNTCHLSHTLEALVVSPANSLVYNCPDSTTRVVVNQEPVGQELGIDYGPRAERDCFLQGKCDEVFLDLIAELGWLEDLEAKEKDLPEASAKLLREKKAS